MNQGSLTWAQEDFAEEVRSGGGGRCEAKGRQGVHTPSRRLLSEHFFPLSGMGVLGRLASCSEQLPGKPGAKPPCRVPWASLWTSLGLRFPHCKMSLLKHLSLKGPAGGKWLKAGQC